MDLSTDSGTLPTHTAVGGPVLGQEMSLFSCHCQTECGGTILLQLLEFKTHLLEAVEELHIRRDAETRFEDQISKLVLEKQELEWEKESLQHQIERAANQHTDSLINVKKQLQVKIRNIEEEKGKYQVSAELKDKEINSLKEELKSLQLRKYNLEKKSTELEQKLALQSRSKDSHLNQLGEVEKRFSALSRQCAMVKQAHEKLEQNVDEAMKIKKKLTSENEKQEATIVSLKKELEEFSNKLIKYKMTLVTQDKAQSPTGREQHCQQLHHLLNMETEMNRKLREENGTVRAEKQEVMRALQHTQQLLLSQTQTVSRVELELQTQREHYQALKQEHGVMREERKAMEDKVAQLMESCAASKNSWDKEKARLLDCIKSEQQALEAVKEAHDKLHQEHTELSSRAKVQAQHVCDVEMRSSSQSLCVSAEVFPTLAGDIRGEETLDEPISSSELPSSGSLQHLASTQTKIPDCLRDTGAVTKLVAMGTTGVSTTSSPGHRSNSGSGDLICDEKSNEENGGMSEKEQGYKDDVKQVKNNREEGEINKEQQWNREDVQGEDVEEGESTGETGTLIAQTTDRQQDSQGSAEDTEDPKQTETETGDRAEGQGPHGADERGKTGLHTAEAQIPAQTTTDTTTKRIDAQQVIDSMDVESPLAACEPPDCSQSLSLKISGKDSSPVTKSYEIQREELPLCPNEYQSVNHEENSVSQEVQTSGNTAPLTAQSHGITSIGETIQPGNTSDIASDMKQTDEMKCEESVLVKTTVQSQAIPGSLDVPEQRGQLRITDDDDNGDSSAFKKRESQSNIETCENYVHETAQQTMKNSKLKDVCTDITMDTADLECQVEMGSSQELMKNDKVEDTGDAKMTKSETDLKQSVNPSQESNASPEAGSTKSCERSPANESLLDESHGSSLLTNKKHRSSFDWSGAQRTAVSSRCKSDVSILRQVVQGSPMLEQNSSGFGGLIRRPPGTIPVFLNKVPLVITRASDLLNTSSFSETAASTRRHQQGESTAPREAYRDTAAAEKQSSASFPVSTSITVSRPSWQTTPGCSRAPTSSAGSGSESDWQPSCSQEREDQQSSFRAQISKIEQFLNTERLSLSKRRRTDN